MEKQGTILAVYCSDELMHKINPSRLMPVHIMAALFLALLAVLIGIKHDVSIMHPQNAFFEEVIVLSLSRGTAHCLVVALQSIQVHCRSQVRVCQNNIGMSDTGVNFTAAADACVRYETPHPYLHDPDRSFRYVVQKQCEFRWSWITAYRISYSCQLMKTDITVNTLIIMCFISGNCELYIT